MTMEKRKWLLIISLIAVIGFISIVYISVKFSETLESEQPITRQPPGLFGPFMGNHIRVPLYILPLSLVLLIVAIVPMSYYFISRRLEEKLEKNFEIISKFMRKNNLVSNRVPVKIGDKNIILKFLNFGERKVVEALIEKKGEILQSEINHMEGMTKLKTHRSVKDLERKGIIKRENYGKTYRIVLLKDIEESILK